MDYNHIEIEKKWRKEWADKKTFKAEDNSEKPKFYALDMFPYPSGAGLHVGHPLGYIASDIYARYKRHQGYNVLHPMGYDSFGLPAEQYAIQTGQHPAVTTKTNIEGGTDKAGNKIPGYRNQLDIMGFSFDWDREVRTSNPDYYKWTQWIFKQIFNSWYNEATNKAEDISELISVFEKEGNANVKATTDQETIFTAEQWSKFTEKEKSDILMNYRLTFLSDTYVNWCPALGTVLANDEIKDGVSERGGHPVERKLMRQWSMRITAYANRLIQDLDTVDWTDSIKEQQKNWIGKSRGASVKFKVLSPALSEGKGAKGYMTGGNHAHLLLDKAKEMRANPTEAEAVLWARLKGKQLDFKIRQQHLIEDFIVDFVCLSKRLVIEVDGEIHNTQREQDEARTKVLEEKGYKVIRFTNSEVLGDIDNVVNEIESQLATRKLVPETEENKEVLPSGKDLGWDYIEVFTTRPDTIFGVNFMVLAPEHELVNQITTPEFKAEVEAYQQKAKLKSERDRQANVKEISGQNTGAFAIHPFTGEKVQIWIGDYVLASYGTGAVMAVPAGDQRDWDFANHFGIEIKNIFKDTDISEGAYEGKDAEIINSDFLNGLTAKKAIGEAIKAIQEKGIGKGKTQFRLRDAIFSRQRYWGEPFPVYYKDEIPYLIEDDKLPVKLPEVDKYLPTEDGEPPLARAEKEAWNVFEGDRMEYNTMPGWAGSSWYFLRYMDPHNENEFVSKEKADYWSQVDLYIGGAEHATGHLLYARFWCKFLFDKGFISFNEPFKKMINQGMILGTSQKVYKVVSGIKYTINNSSKINTADIQQNNFLYYSNNEIHKVILKGEDLFELYYSVDYLEKYPEIREKYDFQIIRTDVNYVNGNQVSVKDFYKTPSVSENYVIVTLEGYYLKNEFIPFNDVEQKGNNKFISFSEVEKMSKTYYNVQTPDELVEKFGADTLRCYEMFLGPLEQAKPWDTKGINGVSSFLRKMWRLFHQNETFTITEGEPDKKALKSLHTIIKKATDDLERFSFNTIVSGLMIAVNELTEQKCNNKEILSQLLILASPYAPHITEELWSKLGNESSISTEPWPTFNPKFLEEDAYAYPVSFNGKMRFKLELPTNLSKEEIEKEVLAAEQSAKYLEGKAPKKVIVVPRKIVNIVV